MFAAPFLVEAVALVCAKCRGGTKSLLSNKWCLVEKYLITSLTLRARSTNWFGVGEAGTIEEEVELTKNADVRVSFRSNGVLLR